MAASADLALASTSTTKFNRETLIQLPTSWEVITYVLVAILVATGLLLSIGSYRKVVVAHGQIAPFAGIAAIVPSKPGIVGRLLVADGQEVKVGTPLVEINTATYLRDGEPLTNRIRSQLARQDSELARQQQAVLDDSLAQERQAEAELTGFSNELQTLSAQEDSQRELVRSAADDLRRTQEIADRGFISAHEQQARRDLLTSRSLQLEQLKQLEAAKRSSIAETQSTISGIRAKAQQQVASLASQRAQIGQELSNADSADSYVLKAPIAGTVTGLAARIGGSADVQSQLMMVVPQGGRLEARLAVPTDAIAFVRKGQEVRLAIDAFPYETYGPVDARIRAVSGAATHVQGGEASYLVTASLAKESLPAFGGHYALRPGMTLTGRITTQNRSLLGWLFEPLLAVRNR